MDCCGKASTSKRFQSGAQKRQKLKKQKLQNAADSCVSIKQFIRNIPNTLTETETRQCAEGQQEQQEQEQCQLQQSIQKTFFKSLYEVVRTITLIKQQKSKIILLCG